MDAAALLLKARAGDETSFESLVAPLRPELVSYCYRLLGSLADADDLAQEALLRAWRGLGGFDGRASLKTWLYRIATNACLTELERRPRRGLPDARGEPSDGGSPPSAPMTEPVWLSPCPRSTWETEKQGPEARYASRESVAIAFLALVQELPPLQRAVLVLRDVLGWSAAETAEILETSVAAVNSALQRARAATEAWRNDRSARVARGPEDERGRELLSAYVRAWEAGDMAGLAKLLREDATLTMPPVPTWFRGREVVTRFLGFMLPTMGAQRVVAIEASGAPGFAVYVRAPGDEVFRAQGIQVLDVDARSIARVDMFLDPALFVRFGLSDTLP